MKRVLIVLVIFMVGGLGSAHADIINGGFEDGLNGWANEITNGTYTTAVVSSYATTETGGYSFTPREGNSMLQIFMQNPIARTYQDVFLNEGDTIQGYAGLDTIFSGANFSIIFVTVSILNQDEVVATLLENDGGAFDWTFWSWNATASGDYSLEFSFTPFLAGISPHTGYAFFDAIEVIEAGNENAPVPEPATMLLLGTGLIGLAGFRKKFKK